MKQGYQEVQRNDHHMRTCLPKLQLSCLLDIWIWVVGAREEIGQCRQVHLGEFVVDWRVMTVATGQVMDRKQ